jgi:hypothetical protein
MSEPAATAPSLETIPFAVLVDEAWRSSRRYARALLVPLLIAIAPAALVMQVGMALWNLQLLGADTAGPISTRCAASWRSAASSWCSSASGSSASTAR